MDADPSRRTQRLMYEAELLAAHALTQEGALQQVCESGALVLAEQSLAALVAELATPLPLEGESWQQLLKALPETLQERRLLERALLTTDGALYALYVRLEQRRTGYAPGSMGLIATTVTGRDRVDQLKEQLIALRALANALRESSRFC